MIWKHFHLIVTFWKLDENSVIISFYTKTSFILSFYLSLIKACLCGWYVVNFSDTNSPEVSI